MKTKKIISAFVLALILMLSSVFMGACFEGESAYQIAVRNGFTGTEAEWLQSLKGKDGENAVEFDIYNVYETFKETNPDVTFEEFLSQYLNVSTGAKEVAANKAIRSVVSIICGFQKTVSGFGGGRVEEYYSAGSGVIYQLDKSVGTGYVITNFHVVYDSDSNATNKISTDIQLYFYGREYSDWAVNATFVGGSSQYDIAVVKFEGLDLSKMAVEQAVMGNSNDISLGEDVIALGNPNGEGLSVVAGIVSVESENIEMQGIVNSSETSKFRVIRFDAPINGGNSGGGLFNLRGEFIGIVNAKTVQEGVEGMCYAIPCTTASGVANSFIDGFNKKCILGITTVVSDVTTTFDLSSSRTIITETMRVESVSSGALASGKILVGDVLKSVKLNGADELVLNRSFHLADYLFKVRGNDVITLTVIRNGVETDVNITALDNKMSDL